MVRMRETVGVASVWFDCLIEVAVGTLGSLLRQAGITAAEHAAGALTRNALISSR